MQKLIVAAVFMCAAVAAEAEPVYSVSSGEDSGHSKITETNDGAKDLWAGGAKANQPGVDYIAISQTRTPANQDSEFVGKSFTIGSIAKGKSITLADKQNGHTLTWGNEGLFLESGSWQGWDALPDNGCMSTFAGTVTVTAPKAKPFGIYPTADGKSRTAYRLCIAAKFKSSADAGVYISDNTTKALTNAMQVFVTGDTTEYFGEIVAKSNGYLTVSGSPFAGSLILNACSSLTLSNGCTTVSSLTVNPNAPVSVYLNYDVESAAMVPFTVTKELVLAEDAQKIKVVIPAAAVGEKAGGKTLELVKMEGEGTLSLDDFEFVGLSNFSDTLFYVNEPQLSADGKTISIQLESNFVTMRNADASGYTSLTDLTSSGKSTPTNWTDNVLPHKDAIYKIDKTLRTSPDSAYNPHIDVFPGKKIVFVGGGTLALKSGGFESMNAVFCGGVVTVYGAPTPQYLRGRAKIMPPTGSANTKFESQNMRILAVEAALSGDGTLEFGYNAKDTQIWLYGDNSDFCGRLVIQGTDETKNPCVSVTNALALGRGSKDGVLDSEAFRILKYGKLLARDSFSYYDEQRCFRLGANARIGVDEGKECEIRSRIKMEGALLKEDPGTLALGNYFLGFGYGNSGTPDDGVNNIINVNGGTLKVTHVNAVDGARIVLADGTRMMTGKDLGDKGFLDVKTDVPFSTAAADGKIHFAVDAADKNGQMEFSIPLCTVRAAAAETFAGNLVVEKPMPGYRVRGVTQTTNDDGSVTFTADFIRTGMVLIVQ